MSDWPRLALNRVRLGQPLALVTILAVEGSAPREPGARMLVWSAGQWGTIGGGALEHQVANQARRLLSLDTGPRFAIQDYPLGPLLAQCCGGRVRLMIERLEAEDDAWLNEAVRVAKAPGGHEIRQRLGSAARTVAKAPSMKVPPVLIDGAPATARGGKPVAGTIITLTLGSRAARLRLFGAGHIGRAIAQALAPLPFRLDWYDTRPEIAAEAGARLLGPEALRWIAADPTPFTLVLTHDHALDYALVEATLSGGADGGYVGLIGSRTKRTRFLKRLREAGLGEDALGRLVCPIGLAALTGKAPEVIAASVAADLLIRLESPSRAARERVSLASL